jgi:hypothetical protein
MARDRLPKGALQKAAEKMVSDSAKKRKRVRHIGIPGSVREITRMTDTDGNKPSARPLLECSLDFLQYYLDCSAIPPTPADLQWYIGQVKVEF